MLTILFIPPAQTTPVDIYQLIREVGVVATIVILSFLGVWKVIVPAVVKRWEEANKERVEREAEAREALEQSRLYLLKELTRMQEESRADKSALLSAYVANTEANTKLAGTLDQINGQLLSLTTEVTTLKGDVSKVYLILGSDRRLIEGRVIESGKEK